MQKTQTAVKESEKQKITAKKPDSTLLDIIKRMNGFKQNVWKQIDKIQTIQLVLQDFGNMGILNRFTGLKSLTLINCGISLIQDQMILLSFNSYG